MLCRMTSCLRIGDRDRPGAAVRSGSGMADACAATGEAARAWLVGVGAARLAAGRVIGSRVRRMWVAIQARRTRSAIRAATATTNLHHACASPSTALITTVAGAASYVRSSRVGNTGKAVGNP